MSPITVEEKISKAVDNFEGVSAADRVTAKWILNEFASNFDAYRPEMARVLLFLLVESRKHCLEPISELDMLRGFETLFKNMGAFWSQPPVVEKQRFKPDGRSIRRMLKTLKKPVMKMETDGFAEILEKW